MRASRTAVAALRALPEARPPWRPRAWQRASQSGWCHRLGSVAALAAQRALILSIERATASISGRGSRGVLCSTTCSEHRVVAAEGLPVVCVGSGPGLARRDAEPGGQLAEGVGPLGAPLGRQPEVPVAGGRVVGEVAGVAGVAADGFDHGRCYGPEPLLGALEVSGAAQHRLGEAPDRVLVAGLSAGDGPAGRRDGALCDGPVEPLGVVDVDHHGGPRGGRGADLDARVLPALARPDPPGPPIPLRPPLAVADQRARVHLDQALAHRLGGAQDRPPDRGGSGAGATDFEGQDCQMGARREPNVAEMLDGTTGPQYR